MANEERVVRALKSLERRMTKGFEAVGQRFDGIDRRLDAVDERFEAFDQRSATFEGRFDSLEGRFDTLEGRFDTLEGRFDTLGGRFDPLEGRFDTLEGRFGTLEGRFGTLEQQVAANTGAILRLEVRVSGFDNQFLAVARRFDKLDERLEALAAEQAELRADMSGKFDSVFAWLERLQAEYHMLVAGMRRLEEQMAEDREDRKRLKEQVSDLRERVKDLETRLRELEARLEDETQAGPTPGKPS